MTVAMGRLPLHQEKDRCHIVSDMVSWFGGDGLMFGLDDLRGLSNPKDFMTPWEHLYSGKGGC